MKKQIVRWGILGLLIGLMWGCFSMVPSAGKLEHQSSSNISDIPDIPTLELPQHQDFRIVVLSDLNSQYGSTEYEPEVTQAIARLPLWQPDLILCGGDMIAGQKSSLSKPEINAMWQAFEQKIAQPVANYQIPFGFTIGNHDGSGAIKNGAWLFSQERELAQAYWRHKKLGLNFIDQSHFPFYYSFQQQGIFFLVWDASTADLAPEQQDWIQQSLNSDVAQQASLKIVLGHLPLYPVAATKNKPGEYLSQGKKLEELLVQNRVLAYISGHHHVYYPGKVENLELLHAGALGQGARQLIDSDLSPRSTVTIVDLNLTNKKLQYTTYDAKTWHVINIKQLPSHILTKERKINRHDL